MPKPLWAPWRLEYVQHADELDRCIFCEPEPELLVHDGELALLVLNKFPYSSGHLLIAPKRHLGEFGALSADEALEIHRLGATRDRGAAARSTRRTGSTSAGISAAPRAPGSRTTCTCMSSRAGTATRASCPCSAT